VFLTKIDEMSGDQTEDNFYTDEQLIVVLMDLFMTGSETLGGSLSYALLFMILHPEVQQKVQKEIDEIVGIDEEVQFHHRPK
jgi:cytochrome P450